MSYTILVTCDQCGQRAKEMPSQKQAREAAWNLGWLQVRNLGKHFCPVCRIEFETKNTNPKTETSPGLVNARKSASARAREEIACRMRSKGKTYTDIGAALGVSGSRAQEIVSLSISRLRRHIARKDAESRNKSDIRIISDDLSELYDQLHGSGADAASAYLKLKDWQE